MKELEHGYESNEAFLRDAPDGTSFHFNSEKDAWRKVDGFWISDLSGDRMLGFTGWEGWTINRIEYPDSKPTPWTGDALTQRQLEELTRFTNTQIQEAYERGKKDAGDEQRQYGYDAGYLDGKKAGYAEGYDAGDEAGYDRGYDIASDIYNR